MDASLLALDVALIVLAAARLTRLAAVDTIGGPFRTLVRATGKTLGGGRGLVWGDELATCPHCMSVWLSGAVVMSYAAWAGSVWRTVAGVFAVSYIAGHLVARLDVGDDDG